MVEIKQFLNDKIFLQKSVQELLPTPYSLLPIFTHKGRKC